MNRLFVRRNISTVSIIVFIIFFCFLQAFSPSFLYNPDGSFKPFGLGYKHKTVIINIDMPANQTVIIVESPAKCDKIEKYLGPGYKCIASYGHLQQLSSLKDIDIENNFKPTFTLMESKEQQVEKMRKMIKNIHFYTKNM